MPDDETVVDPSALDRLLRIGGQDFLLEMIDLFLANAPHRLTAARVGFELGDHARVYGAAHSLKSTAGNLGARGLQGVSERVEERANAGDRDALGPLLEELARRYEEVRDRLESERRRRRGDH